MLETDGAKGQNTALLLAALIVLFLATLSTSGCTGVAQQTTQAAPQISVVPSSISFANVTVGQKSTQTVQISNTGKANLNVTGISLTGTGFSMSSVAVPFQLAPGASMSFTVTFSASSTTAATATLTITSDAPSSPLNIAIQGTGVAASASWQMTPTSLSFPSTVLQATSTLPATISNTGNVPVTISSITISNAEWTTTGLTTGTTLAAGQQLNFQVTFSPTVTGSSTGSLTVGSSSTTSVLTAQLSGSGSSTTTQHTVTLNWSASSSAVAGYNVYRGAVSGGPYSLVNSSLDTNTSYVDSTVVSGSKYFYVTTAVDSLGVESNFSNEISATIPNP